MTLVLFSSNGEQPMQRNEVNIIRLKDRLAVSLVDDAVALKLR
jgi:hypothetical protein